MFRGPHAYSMGSNTILRQVSSDYIEIPQKRKMLIIYSKWRAWTAIAATVGMAVAFAATEAILIVTLRVR
jgi:hypothetical protein